MATTLHKRKMTEAKLNTCRAFMSTKDPNYPPNAPLSYLFSITTSQPKTRIKIPNLLAKTMQRRSNGCTNANDDHHKDKKKWANPKNLLPKKVGSLLSSVFGNKNSPKTYSKLQRNADSDQSDSAKAEAQIFESDDTSYGRDIFAVAPESPVYKSSSLKKLLEVKDKEEEQKRLRMQKPEKKPGMADKYPKFSIPFSSFFHKHTSLNFIRSKISKTNTNNNLSCNCTRCNTSVNDGIVIRRQGSACKMPRLPSFTNIDDTVDTVIRRQESSSNLPRVPSRVLTTRRKLKMARSLRKMANRQLRGKLEQDDEETEDRHGEELWKKRILMGEKCKPLNLHYDNDGILLPEFL